MAAWFATAAADSRVYVAMIQSALQPGRWRCVSFLSLCLLSSQMFASHIANTCIFLFVSFGDSNSYAFVSSRGVEFSHMEASMTESFLFATAICSVVFFFFF